MCASSIRYHYGQVVLAHNLLDAHNQPPYVHHDIRDAGDAEIIVALQLHISLLPQMPQYGRY